MRRHLLLLAALLGVSLVPASGFAQPQAGARPLSSDTDRTTARELGQEGHVALDQHDFATAADRFARADALVHAPTFVLGLAQAKLGLGKLVSAFEAYNRIVREGVPPNAPAAFVRALEDARRELDALAPRLPYVIIQVTGASAPKVSVDGAELAAAAIGIKRAVDPGKHTIHASADGGTAREVVVTVAEGKVETVTLDLASSKPETAAAPPATPPPAVAPPPEAAPGSGSTRRTLGIAGLAAGGAGLALGAIMGGLAVAKHGDLSKSCPNGACPLSRQVTLGPQVDSYHTYSTVSTAGFVAGGALAAAGVVLFVTAPKPAPAAEGATVGPVIGVGWVGAEGRF